MYKKEFEYRLIKLRNAIDYYFESGRTYNLMPSLASVFRYLWTDKNALKYRK